MNPVTKTREEIEALKQNWANDPCYELVEVEGFEAHREELAAFVAFTVARRKSQDLIHTIHSGQKALELKGVFEQVEQLINMAEFILLYADHVVAALRAYPPPPVESPPDNPGSQFDHADF